MSDPKNSKFSFTVSFHFQQGKSFFDGFTLETKISADMGARYRILVKHPEEGAFYTMKGMEEPMSQKEIDDVLRKQYNGSIMADEFAFEVYDRNGTKIFATRFDAISKVPVGLENDQTSFTTFCWGFDLQRDLQEQAK